MRCGQTRHDRHDRPDRREQNRDACPKRVRHVREACSSLMDEDLLSELRGWDPHLLHCCTVRP